MISLFEDYFKKPSARVLALRELETTQRQLLASEDAAAYHAKMSEYYEEKVERLANYINRFKAQ